MSSGLLLHPCGVIATGEIFTFQKTLSKTLISMKANNPKIKPYVRDETSVLVSVRIETDIVTAIDKWCKAYPNFNRSIVINRLLYAAVALIDPLSFHDLVSLYHPDPKESNLVFERTPSEARA